VSEGTRALRLVHAGDGAEASGDAGRSGRRIQPCRRHHTACGPRSSSKNALPTPKAFLALCGGQEREPGRVAAPVQEPALRLATLDSAPAPAQAMELV
jgi:hypothetical protein